MPFAAEMSGWWWLYWRFYDTHIPLDYINLALGSDAEKARRWLGFIERAGFAVRRAGCLDLNDRGAFWLHLAQNYFALNYCKHPLDRGAPASMAAGAGDLGYRVTSWLRLSGENM